MNEEIDLLKYILTNLKIQQDMLCKILKKKEVKDDVYDLINYNIIEYRKFIVSLKRMLENRQKKYNSETNVILGIAGSIGANINTNEKNEDYLITLREYSKVNMMDIQKVRKEYKIKSKTIEKLLCRLEEFERGLLDKINIYLKEK